LVLNKKHERNPMIQEQKRKPEKLQGMDNGKGKSIGHQCLVVEDRRWMMCIYIYIDRK